MLLLCISLLPYMEASFSFPDFVRIASQPVIHLVYTSYLKTVALSQLQLYLHVFYIGYGHVHRQGFPFTSPHVVWLLAKTLKTCTNLWALSCPVDQAHSGAQQTWAELTDDFFPQKLCHSTQFVPALAGIWKAGWLRCWGSDQQVLVPVSAGWKHLHLHTWEAAESGSQFLGFW